MEDSQVMKIIGKRKPYSGGLAGANEFFEMMIRLRGDQPFIPRGVYRFKTLVITHIFSGLALGALMSNCLGQLTLLVRRRLPVPQGKLTL